MTKTVLTIRTYLWAESVPWSSEQSEQLLDDLGNFFAERGFVTGDGDSQVRCVIAAGHEEIPDDPKAFMAQLNPATGMIVIPRKGD